MKHLGLLIALCGVGCDNVVTVGNDNKVNDTEEYVVEVSTRSTLAKYFPAEVFAEKPHVVRLLEADTIRIDFYSAATLALRKNPPEIEISKEGMEPITYAQIDLTKGKAVMVANTGSTDVQVLLTDTGLTFVETTGGGNFMITTVFFNQKITNKYVAVHSRHNSGWEALGGPPMPQQHYGTCCFIHHGASN